jgi:hypothetical protein
MKYNYKFAEWYGEKHLEPNDWYIYSNDFGFEKAGFLQIIISSNLIDCYTFGIPFSEANFIS